LGCLDGRGEKGPSNLPSLPARPTSPRQAKAKRQTATTHIYNIDSLKKQIDVPIRTKMDQAHLALDKVSSDFAKNINFSKVHWSWSANTSSFYSVGGLPLVNVGPVDINSTIKGYMEFIKKPNKEEFYGYWELSTKQISVSLGKRVHRIRSL
jgi:hypothetical protein